MDIYCFLLRTTELGTLDNVEVRMARANFKATFMTVRSYCVYSNVVYLCLKETFQM